MRASGVRGGRVKPTTAPPSVPRRASTVPPWRLDDVGHDRQAESRPGSAARRGGPVEAVEDVGQVDVVDAAAVVADLDPAGGAGDLDRSPLIELQGVLHQVAHGSLQRERLSRHRGVVRDDLHLAPGSLCRPAGHPLDERTQIDGLVRLVVAPVGGQVDHLVDEPGQLVGLALQVVEQLSALCRSQLIGAPQGIDVGPQARQRGAQLVPGVLDEPLLVASERASVRSIALNAAASRPVSSEPLTGTETSSWCVSVTSSAAAVSRTRRRVTWRAINHPRAIATRTTISAASDDVRAQPGQDPLDLGQAPGGLHRTATTLDPGGQHPVGLRAHLDVADDAPCGPGGDAPVDRLHRQRAALHRHGRPGRGDELHDDVGLAAEPEPLIGTRSTGWAVRPSRHPCSSFEQRSVDLLEQLVGRGAVAEHADRRGGDRGERDQRQHELESQAHRVGPSHRAVIRLIGRSAASVSPPGACSRRRGRCGSASCRGHDPPCVAGS